MRDDVGVPGADSSIRAGTIFADSRLPRTTWFAAAWQVCRQKAGVSALGLKRALGLGSYETAWSLLHKLRRAMVRPGRELLAGELEVDGSYVGRRLAAGKRGRGAAGARRSSRSPSKRCRLGLQGNASAWMTRQHRTVAAGAGARTSRPYVVQPLETTS